MWGIGYVFGINVFWFKEFGSLLDNIIFFIVFRIRIIFDVILLMCFFVDFLCYFIKEEVFVRVGFRLFFYLRFLIYRDLLNSMFLGRKFLKCICIEFWL